MLGTTEIKIKKIFWVQYCVAMGMNCLSFSDRVARSFKKEKTHLVRIYGQDGKRYDVETLILTKFMYEERKVKSTQGLVHLFSNPLAVSARSMNYLALLLKENTLQFPDC